MTGRYTPDDVLVALYSGESAARINGRKVRRESFEALARRGSLYMDGDTPILTKQGESQAMAKLNGIGQAQFHAPTVRENLVDHRPNKLQFRWFDHHHLPTFDVGQCDYEWWDKARRGKVQGFEIAGLFLRPIASKKAAWVLGEQPKFGFDDPDTQEQVNDWFREHHADILMAMEESVTMGDYYIAVNPDETITILPPNVVEPIVDPNNFSKQVGWRIRQAFSHPQTPWLVQTIIDEYYADKRVQTIIAANGVKGTPKTYKNFTGLLPIIHVANNRRGGEMFGHPEAEALVQTLHNYGEVADTATEGNLRQGRPTPVFESLGSQANIDAFIKAFGRDERRLLPSGEYETYTVIEFSSDQVVYLGEDGKFKYASPGQFTGDTMNILQIFFYLIIQHTEMPEFIWGGAIASSKASAEVQMPPFTKWVEKEQGRAEKWLIPLITYITALKALTDRKIKYQDGMKPKVKWMPLTTKDDTLTLEAIKVALTQGGWKPEWVVPYMPLDIDNPEKIIAGIVAQEEENRRMANGENEPFIGNQRDSPTGDSNEDENEAAPEAEAETWHKQLKEVAHTGAMVAFEVPLDTAKHLSLAAQQAGLEAIRPEDMHIALAYMGEISQLEAKREAIEAALAEFTLLFGSLEGAIGGSGRFNASNTSDGMDVIYASFDSPELSEFRQGLVEAIEDTGVEISRMHGFTPHIKLAYVEKGSAMPNLALETMALTFNEIVLAWGDERKVFALKQNDAELVLEMV
jgi:2'-5' RNA ligase